MKTLKRIALVALAAVVAVPAGAAFGAADHSLDSFVVPAQQVGSGYRMTVQQGGRRVANMVTLDLCGRDFPSEGLRTNRLQVVYKRSRRRLGFSNEVVRYSGNGALQALAEVRHAAAHCPRHRVRSHVRGIPPSQTRIKVFTGPGLEPDSLGLLIHTDARLHGKRVRFWNAAVYQVRGNVLSGVYTFRKSAATQRRGALRVAAQSAKVLNAQLP